MKKLLFFSLLLIIKPAFSQQISFDTITNYLMTFETYPNRFFEQVSSSTTIWQIGHPQKVGFTSAYNGQHALVTDTVDAYLASHYSCFDIRISYDDMDYPFVGIEFWHKFDTDTLADGGYITVSYDNGETWANIINDTLHDMWSSTPHQPHMEYFYENLYTNDDALINGESGFSGFMNEWQLVKFAWFDMIVKKTDFYDQMIIRFNFISDEVDNAHDGWIIDNLRVYSINLGGSVSDAGAGSVTIFPNPVTAASRLNVSDNSSLEHIQVFTLQGTLVYNEIKPDINIGIGRLKLNPGVYLLVFELGNGQQGYTKFVKQ